LRDQLHAKPLKNMGYITSDAAATVTLLRAPATSSGSSKYLQGVLLPELVAGALRSVTVAAASLVIYPIFIEGTKL
jgi:hypothetical protein